MSGWTLAVLAEGYLAEDEALFEQHVEELRDALFALPPFDRPNVQRHVTISGAFFPSNDRGAGSGWTGLGHDTAFSVGVRDDGHIRFYRRGLKQIHRSHQHVPGRDASLLLVNDDRGGGVALGNRAVALRNDVDAVRDVVDTSLTALEDARAHYDAQLEGLESQMIAAGDITSRALEATPTPAERWALLHRQARFLLATEPPSELLQQVVETYDGWVYRDESVRILEEVRDTTPGGLTAYRTAIHEIGHLLDLGDEYDGSPGTSAGIVYGPGGSPNTARERRFFNEITWTDHFDHPGHSEVIWENPDCDQSKSEQNVLMPRDMVPGLRLDHVGVIEGAQTRNCTRFKPSFDCIMNAHRISESALPTLANSRFCPVCEAAIERRILETAG